MRRQNDSVQFGRTTIHYVIERTSRRKTIAITVAPDASVRVMAPAGTRRTRIAQAVQPKAEWILRQQERFWQMAASRPRQFVSGETFLYLGRQYRLKVVRDREGDGRRRGTELRVRLSAGALEVSSGSMVTANPVDVRTALASWYRYRAREYLPALADKYARMLGVKYESLSIVNLRKRWGSGGPNGRLRFNWRIMMASPSLLSYVVAHEVCHISHPHHSPTFWRTLERLMPDCLKRSGQLRNIGPKLSF